jgi:sulfoacetaldehyde dehydrogenase
MTTKKDEATKGYINELINRARQAQNVLESHSQEQVDRLITAIGWAMVNEEKSREFARLAFVETDMGDIESKYMKFQKKIRGLLRDLKGVKSVGVIKEDNENGIIEVAKPVGVIGALIPCTNPEITPVIKAINAIKGRNAVVFSPHPRSKRTTFEVVGLMREVLKKYKAPADTLICIEEPTKEISQELMRQCDLVIATGGSNMVRAAYSSGTPAYGVGAGNAVIVIDETANLKDAAMKIRISKTADLATGCSSDNSIVVQEDIYEDLLKALKEEKGYLVNSEEKELLQKVLWVDGHLNGEIIARPATRIAEIAGFEVPEDTRFIMVEETGIGKDYPFSGEKLSVVLTVYKYKDFNEAVEKVNTIQQYQGAGHSCGIHSFNEEHIMQLSCQTKTSRVMVRQAQAVGNSGDWGNGMPFTVTLGCGTWGGNITTENITWKHYINITRVAFPIEEVIPSDEEIFGDIIYQEQFF